MDLKELALLVKSTRDAQRRYFLHQKSRDGVEARRLEQDLDRAVAAILSGQLEIFDWPHKPHEEER